MNAKSETSTTFEDLELVATRTFAAPRELVFQVMTQPEHMAHWWGPAQYEFDVKEFDFRVGGGWRYIQKGGDGEFGFHGKYLAIEPPRRVVQTFVFEGTPDDSMIESFELEEHDGQTTMRAYGKFSSPEAFKAAMESGMEEGMNESYERLAAYLVERAAK